MTAKVKDIVLEIYEAGTCGRHKVGQRFSYPKDRGKVCEWLLGSARTMIEVLHFGGILPWTYKGTPYEKQVDPETVTTEFVRCPDPTDAGVVLKIIATNIEWKKTQEEENTNE